MIGMLLKHANESKLVCMRLAHLAGGTAVQQAVARGAVRSFRIHVSSLWQL